ncbi:hypothetical protein C8R47DRAFT_1083448 [Mycena vitilis]|nr:hypothetical protein C8R47DRAFT_1083448 [Mycena vitilis]
MTVGSAVSGGDVGRVRLRSGGYSAYHGRQAGRGARGSPAGVWVPPVAASRSTPVASPRSSSHFIVLMSLSISLPHATSLRAAQRPGATLPRATRGSCSGTRMSAAREQQFREATNPGRSPLIPLLLRTPQDCRADLGCAPPRDYIHTKINSHLPAQRDMIASTARNRLEKDLRAVAGVFGLRALNANVPTAGGTQVKWNRQDPAIAYAGESFIWNRISPRCKFVRYSPSVPVEIAASVHDLVHVATSMKIVFKGHWSLRGRDDVYVLLLDSNGGGNCPLLDAASCTSSKYASASAACQWP